MRKSKSYLFGMPAAALAVVVSLAACGTVGGGRKTSDTVNMVKVVNADAPVAQEQRGLKVAPGNIQVLAPTAFNEGKDDLGSLYTAISGNRNTEIVPKDVRVVFPGGIGFKDTVPDRTEVSTWITNLPNGLSGHIHEAAGGDKMAKEFKILVTGTPTETRKEPVKVTIPGSFLNTGTDTVIDPNSDAIIDIAEAIISITDAASGPVTVAWARSGRTIVIGGSVGSPIQPKLLKIKLIDAATPRPIPERTDLSRWISNLPAGLTALAAETEKDAVEVVLTISGTPEEAIDQAVYVKIPAVDLHRALDLVVEPDEDIRFEIYGLSLSNIIVGGAINNPITPRTATLSFGAGKLLDNIDKDTDLSRWFTNIPAGLKVVATEAALAGAQGMTVTFTGTPTVHVDAPIKVTVPANVIYAGKAFDVARNDASRYDVGTYDVTTSNRVAQDSLNKNWRGSLDWSLNNPKLTSVKDFDPVGIVQITAKAVEEVGPNGEYFWNGETVNYARLMAEAKKMGAHAIINIVIDFDDAITERIERRHVTAGYKLSVEEIAANKKNAGRYTLETNIDGTLTLIETTHRIQRTYTGTALAIKYVITPSGEQATTNPLH